MAIRWSKERQAVVETAGEMARLGLVAGAGGNISLRLSTEPLLVAITPSHRPYKELQQSEIPIIDPAGVVVEGNLEPSTEKLLHTSVYASRRDVGAVIHCHPVYATICAVAGLEIPPIVDELVVLVGGAIQVAKYATPGSRELASHACRTLGQRNAVLLRNHGMLGVGHDLTEALEVCQIVERAAHVYVMTRLLRRTTSLPPEVIAMEEELFRARFPGAHNSPKG